MNITIGLSRLYSDTAKLAEIENYISKAKALADEGHNIIHTGAAPVWLYLHIAHALHGKVKTLSYQSPGLKAQSNPEGITTIFNHSAY